MPLTGLGPILGPLLQLAVGSPPSDSAAQVGFGRLATAIGSWMLLNVVALPGTMVATGATVVGRGKLLCLGGPADFGPKLAVAAGDASALGVTTWTANATALIAAFNNTGLVDPSSFTANPTSGGPLGGTGKVTFLTKPPNAPSLAAAAGITDEAGVTALDNFGTTLLSMIESQATVLPTGLPTPLTAPPGGGPILGFGALL